MKPQTASKPQPALSSIAEAIKLKGQRWGTLETERSLFLGHCREISQYILPYNGRFLQNDRNKGEKRWNHIYDSTGTRALRVLAAGLMAGMTSPARPWFRLATQDRDLMEYGPVKLWLNAVTELMRDVFSRSNTYRALHSLYEELGAFGTAVSIVRPDFQDVVRHYPLTFGEYMIATDHRGEVNTIYRDYEMTVAHMVSDFGRDKCSVAVRNMFDTGKLDSWVPVMHVIEPRADRDLRKRDAKNMAWSSCYFEKGGNQDKYARESGFKRFPAMAPRWNALSGDVLGNGPGMEALGDIKQLQHGQLRKAQGIDYKVKPPLQAPLELKNSPVASLPGGITFYNSTNAQAGIRSAFEVDIDLSHLLEDIRDVRSRINQAFYVDLFLMFANDPQGDKTAREIAERHEEKLLMIGPVLERLHNELLTKKIDLTFDYIIEAGLVPPPPPELQGIDLNIEFVSTLAQAQRAVGVQVVDRLIGTVASLATLKPEVVDKLNGDEIVDRYADMLGIDPNLIVADDQVAIIRQNRKQMAAAQQAAAMAPAAAQTAKTLSEANTGEKNMLTDVMRQFQGYR